MQCLLIYDIVNDSVRSKIADICLDYGLQRIQYSAFSGDLNRNQQEELMQKLKRRLGDCEGKIHLYPVCEKDLRLRKRIEKQKPTAGENRKETP